MDILPSHKWRDIHYGTRGLAFNALSVEGKSAIDPINELRGLP